MINRRFLIINDYRGSKCCLISNFKSLYIHYNYHIKNGEKRNKEVLIDEFVNIKGWKASGNKLDDKKRMSSFKFVENISKAVNEELTLF